MKKKPRETDAHIWAAIGALFVVIAFGVTYSTASVQGFAVSEQTVWFDISVDDVQNLHGAELTITYEGAEFLTVEPGSLWSADGGDVFFPRDIVVAENGVVSQTYLVRLGPSGVSGSGVIASYAFKTQSGAYEFSVQEAILVSDEVLPISDSTLSYSVRTVGLAGTQKSASPLWLLIVLVLGAGLLAAGRVLRTHKKKR